MSDEIRVNRQPQAQQTMKSDMPMQTEMMSKETNSKGPWMILGVIVVVLVVLGVLFRNNLFKGAMMTPQSNTTAMSSKDGYQAVFLTNGQVYFGKLSDIDNQLMDLKDIYYLQVGPQQGSAQAQGTAGQPAPAPQQQISLVKLGNELHGPVDEMHINKTQVLFYEDLKNDGNVVSAILKDKASKTTAPAK